MRRILFAVVLVLLGAARAAWPSCSNTPNMALANCTVGTPRSVSEPAWINNWLLLDFAFTSPIIVTGAGSAGPTVSLTTVPETLGGTGQVAYVQGDTLYASAADTLDRLAANVTTTRKFREQHGNGSSTTSEAWDTVHGPDITSGTIDPARIVTTPTASRCLHIDSGGAIEVASADCAAGTGDSVKVSSTNVVDADFNNTSPAAASGGKNVTWQTTGTGPASISAYVAAADASTNGVVKTTAQTFGGKKTFEGGTVGAGPKGSASLTPGTITANTCSDVALGVTVQTTDTVTQAAAGDPCVLGAPAGGPGTHISATCYFSATSTAQVRFCNSNTGNQTATTGTYKVMALQ